MLASAKKGHLSFLCFDLCLELYKTHKSSQAEKEKSQQREREAWEDMGQAFIKTWRVSLNSTKLYRKGFPSYSCRKLAFEAHLPGRIVLWLENNVGSCYDTGA